MAVRVGYRDSDAWPHRYVLCFIIHFVSDHIRMINWVMRRLNGTFVVRLIFPGQEGQG